MTKSKPYFHKPSSISQVVARSATDSEACYKKHTHEELSIGVITSGVSEYFNDGETRTVGPGSTVIINPGVVHSCNPIGRNTWSYKMLYIDVQLMRQIQNEVYGKNATEFIDFNQQVLECKQSFLWFNGMFSLLVGNTEKLQKEETMFDFLSTLLRMDSHHKSAPLPSKFQNHSVSNAREYIADNCEKELKIDEIATYSGLSRYYLIHSFRKEFGMTPHAYQLAERVNKAKKMLRRGVDISTVALNTGFSDQSHFHRNFKRMVAATPKQYRDCFV